MAKFGRHGGLATRSWETWIDPTGHCLIPKNELAHQVHAALNRRAMQGRPAVRPNAGWRCHLMGGEEACKVVLVLAVVRQPVMHAPRKARQNWAPEWFPCAVKRLTLLSTMVETTGANVSASLGTVKSPRPG